MYPPTWDKTVTVYNCVSERDNTSKADIWYRTVVKNCFYSGKVTRAINGQTVSFASSYICRIPKDKRYKSYSAFKKDPTGFTLSLGDFIVLGEVNDAVTAENRLEVLRKYKGRAFRIDAFRDNSKRDFIPHYSVEGT